MHTRSWFASVAVHSACIGALATAWWTALPTRPVPIRVHILPAVASAQAVLEPPPPALDPPGPLPQPVESDPPLPSVEPLPIEAAPPSAQPEAEWAGEPPQDLFECLEQHARRRVIRNQPVATEPSPTRTESPAPTTEAPTAKAPTERRSVPHTAPAPAPATTPATPLDDGRNQPPAYPEFARKRGLEGVVQLRLDIDATGRVVASRIVTSSGHRSLDEAARRAVLAWRYRPATRSEQAVASTLDQDIAFELR